MRPGLEVVMWLTLGYIQPQVIASVTVPIHGIFHMCMKTEPVYLTVSVVKMYTYLFLKIIVSYNGTWHWTLDATSL